MIYRLELGKPRLDGKVSSFLPASQREGMDRCMLCLASRRDLTRQDSLFEYGCRLAQRYEGVGRARCSRRQACAGLGNCSALARRARLLAERALLDCLSGQRAVTIPCYHESVPMRHLPDGDFSTEARSCRLEWTVLGGDQTC